jgi:hypothetical protein
MIGFSTVSRRLAPESGLSVDDGAPTSVLGSPMIDADPEPFSQVR